MTARPRPAARPDNPPVRNDRRRWRRLLIWVGIPAATLIVLGEVLPDRPEAEPLPVTVRMQYPTPIIVPAP